MEIELEVAPAVLRAAGNVLLHIASRVQEVNVDVQAHTVPAARAFDGWQTGGALDGLATFWPMEFAAMAEQAGRLGNAAFAAASAYTAADQAATTGLGSVDPQYIRGR